MAKLIWDKQGERRFENGVSNGVLYVMQDDGTYGKGVVWNGLVSVSENPTGAEASAIYADNIKYLTLMSVEEFEASIEAYTYPEEFAVCDGSAELTLGVSVSQQPRKTFALCYKTNIGTDINPEAGYKLHIIYGALAAPTERSYETINDSPEAMTFSWEITTTPVAVTGFKPTAHVVIDSTKVESTKMTALLNKLHGAEGTPGDAELLLPDAIKALLAA